MDYGVFVSQNAEKTATGVLVTTKEGEMRVAKRRMLFELVKGYTILQKDQVGVGSLRRSFQERKIGDNHMKQHKP